MAFALFALGYGVTISNVQNPFQFLEEIVYWKCFIFV